ncbi:MAG: antibiotic biosynthesis monooxygenase [Bacteroidota bacterium]
MIVTCVHIHVKPESIEAFKQATLLNHLGTIKEPGNIRFDFLQQEDQPDTFLLYEVFESEEAVKAHKQTEHYLNWREAVNDMMAQNRKGVRHTLLAPTDLALW